MNGMLPISDFLNYPEPKKGPNSERAEMVQKIMELNNEPHDENYARKFKYWLGRTKKLSPSKIYRMLQNAKQGKNPPALFNWLLKQTK